MEKLEKSFLEIKEIIEKSSSNFVVKDQYIEL